jgi:hypothetical protein
MNMSIHKSTTKCYPLHEIDIADKIISCNWRLNPEEVGLASEIVEKVYDDYNGLIVNYLPLVNDQLKVLYTISAEDIDTNWEYLLKMISLFNLVPSVEFWIYGTEKHNNVLKNYSNEHILFINSIDVETCGKDISTNLVITYGPGALHFLKQGVPVIIAGPFGLGGWVTEENISFLIRDAFMGRPGGTAGESIPPNIFIHELLCIKECKNIDEQILFTQVCSRNLPYKQLSDAPNIIGNANILYQQLNDFDKRWELFPRIASNIFFDQTTEDVLIKRTLINDTICTLAREDIDFFNKVREGHSCKVLNEYLGMNEDEFWGIINSLFLKRIILF